MLIFHYFSGFSSEFVKSFKYGFPSNWLSLVSDHFNSQSRLVFVICFERAWEDTCDMYATSEPLYGYLRQSQSRDNCHS